jgi:hypothetical protein
VDPLDFHRRGVAGGAFARSLAALHRAFGGATVNSSARIVRFVG